MCAQKVAIVDKNMHRHWWSTEAQTDMFVSTQKHDRAAADHGVRTNENLASSRMLGWCIAFSYIFLQHGH